MEFSPQSTPGIRRLHETEVWHLRLHNFLERLCLQWHQLVSSRRPRSEPTELSFILIALSLLRVLKGLLDGDAFLERSPGFTTPQLIKEALAPLGAGDTPIGAMLLLLHGKRKMQCALQQFLVENARARLRHVDETQHVQPEAVNAQEHETGADKDYIALGPIVAWSDLPPMSQIYVNFSTGGGRQCQERIITIDTPDIDKRRWPHKLAQAFNEFSALPLQAGQRNGAGVVTDAEKEVFIFIDANATYDFTLQWTLINEKAPPQTHPFDAWLPFPRTVDKSGKTFLTYLDFSSLRLQADAPAMSLPLRRNFPLKVPRVVIQMIENGSRMIIMQRRLPRECYDSNAKLAHYIAGEINDYTACLKFGEKQGGVISPVASVDGNRVHVDPNYLQQSQLMANVVLA
ncbi:hypothetical protein JZM24_07860 [Candidatus Sodalis endolongispinus]|uniref:Uncharacterized protein n=1 Tax=Candidatus Sodalis endolongispinus TaxID=2812662 RepID=A0ABS5YAP4_9GAMM|nr:hypothetical protein [Candidatus Sodalis endolongispinus]MBT9432057.1 hypothetical protein [Candidatus Sodalis endolongispinus]